MFITFSLPLHRLFAKEFLNDMKTSELLKSLKDAGCVLARHGSGHDKWVNPKTGKSVFVPRYAGEVHKGLALKILKELVGE